MAFMIYFDTMKDYVKQNANKISSINEISWWINNTKENIKVATSLVEYNKTVPDPKFQLMADKYCEENLKELENDLKILEERKVFLVQEFEKNKLDSFEVLGDRLVISDPCYKRSVWCRGEVDNVLPGKWQGNVVRKMGDPGWGIRVHQLFAWHESVKDKFQTIEKPKVNWIRTKIDVGVDSGQAGIFCEKQYPQDDEEVSEKEDMTSFWSRTSSITMDHDWGIVKEGIVSSSGYGDGSYECFIATNNNKVVAVRIKYI